MAMPVRELDGFVSVERGEVDRRIFSDPDVFELELELIFGRAWLFLCHESQVRKAGDFFEAPMGRDNVLVVRQKDGSVKGLLNTCAHRGNAVCRAEEGNTRNFMCTYHGWTYDLAGKLIGVPGLDKLFHNELDRDRLGLREVAQLDSYKGFVFATMDRAAPPLAEFLGGTGRLAIDLLASRGDLEAVPGVQKFVIPCNWKFAVDNLFDWYHPAITHMSANGIILPPPDKPPASVVDDGGATTPDGVVLSAAAGQPTTDQEMMVVVGEYGHAIAGPTYEAFQEQLLGGGPMAAIFEQPFRATPEGEALLGPVGKDVAGHPNIFPTMWITNLQISLRVPRGPHETEIWWYTFVPRELEPDKRAMVVMMANHVFGPAGMLEQEDGENWAQSTMQTRGYASSRVPQQLKMNLGRGVLERERERGFSWFKGHITEHAQLWTYKAWADWMTGSDWDKLREATEPPEVL
jgi:phenylpropionate dioxygenase-like ring-hydroxylating dioxygenase large terminal subunit